MNLKRERKATYAATSGGISTFIVSYFNFPMWLLILTVLGAIYLSIRLLNSSEKITQKIGIYKKRICINS